ncbi:TetR/AcrR family transcriptional regulator [Deinococcus sp.]|uniref:TetR/AcrR family transcriptional regulator n=1 Tax=Deinococcus sp. TaxID=47478 RepID=UPI0025B926C3|nr:TetR/AcrR family transcriptional regulator [Deinococcus sp.]
MTVALPRPTERRTQAERSETMRQKLIEATLDCLVTDGYVGLTISKVTERAGVSRGAPLHHFSSKSGLMEAAARELVSRLSRKLVGAFAQSQQAADPVEAFIFAVWRDIFTAQEGAMLAELTYASRREPELETIVKRLWTRVYLIMGRVATRYVRSNRPDIPPERVLFLTQWLMRGMAQDVPLGAPPELFKAYLRLWRTTLLEAANLEPGGRPGEVSEGPSRGSGAPAGPPYHADPPTDSG